VWNPGTLLFSVVLLLAVAAVTIALPARRAANVDPMAAAQMCENALTAVRSSANFLA
jgi:hypothetical protein